MEEFVHTQDNARPLTEEILTDFLETQEECSTISNSISATDLEREFWVMGYKMTIHVVTCTLLIINYYYMDFILIVSTK